MLELGDILLSEILIWGFVIGDCRCHLLAKLFAGLLSSFVRLLPWLWSKRRVMREIRGERKGKGRGKIANHPRENLKKAAIRGRKECKSEEEKKRRCLMTMLSFLGAVLGNGTAGTK